MNNQFNSDELVKVSGKSYPVVGGRLRLAHDENKALSIETNIIHQDNDKVTVQAKITTDKGIFSGLGNATITRDAKLKNAILELAETRAIARALRFAGYGVEYTGAEEMPEEPQHKPDEEPNRPDEVKIKALEALILKKGKTIKGCLTAAGVTSLKEMTMEQYFKAQKYYDSLPDKAS